MWQEYHFAASVDDAVETLTRYGDETRLVAGGTDLLVELRNGEAPPRILVDVTRLPGLREIRQADGRIVLGAGVTFTQILASPLLRARALPLVEAASAVGSTQIRHLGTLGGNLATASPAGDSLPALMALDARLTLAGPQGRRELPLEAFLVGVKRTALAPGELIEKIAFPAMGPRTRGAFLKLRLRKALAIAVVNVAVVVRMDGDQVADARIALGAVAPTVIRAREAKESLVGHPLSDEAIARAGEVAMAAVRPIDDIRGSAAYRREMVGVLVRRALRFQPSHPPPHPPSSSPKIGGVGGRAGDRVQMIVNGREVTVTEVAGKTLLQVLREDLGLTGTKDGCSEGECGACTVLLDGQAVTSCLIPAPQAHGRSVETVEGLARDGQLHPLQRAFLEAGAPQCGYCIPGMLMSAKGLLDANPHPSQAEIERALAGNLCRCTGYYQIVQAIERAAGGGR